MDATVFTALGLGLSVGCILALTGAGGAILAVPLLIFALDLTVSEAAPISLLAVAFAALVGALLGFKAHILRYKAAMVMSAAGLCFSPVGLWAATHIPNRPLSGIFALLLLFVSTKIYRQAQQELNGKATSQKVGPPCLLDQTRGKVVWTLPCFKTMVAAGMLTGLLSGLLGVGGGFVIVPALKKVTDLPMRSIIATSLGVITLVSLGGVAGATYYGAMNWEIALPFSCGALTGMLAGRSIGERMKGPRLQQSFAAFAFVTAIGMLFRAIA